MDKGQVKIRLKNDLFLRIKSEAFLSGKTVSRYISDRLEASFLTTETAKKNEFPDIKVELKTAVDGVIESLKSEIRGLEFSKNSEGIDPRFAKILVENLAWIRLYLLNFGMKSMPAQDASDAKTAADARAKVAAENLMKEIGG